MVLEAHATWTAQDRAAEQLAGIPPAPRRAGPACAFLRRCHAARGAARYPEKMCRMLMFQGAEEVALARFLRDRPHSLAQQAQAPKELEPNQPSADGWGVAWYSAAEVAPGAYRTVVPMWRDQNVDTLTPYVRARHFLGATRVATGGSELSITNVQPFVRGCVAFAHNGELQDFEEAFLSPLRDALTDAQRATPRGVTDSAHLFALLLDRCQQHSDLSKATDALVLFVDDVCRRVNRGAKLNLLISNGQDAVAVRYATAGQRQPSLYWRQLEHGVLVASERLDDEPAWRAVPGNIRLTFRDGSLLEEHRLETVPGGV